MKKTILTTALLFITTLCVAKDHYDCPLTTVVNDSQIILTYDTTFDLSGIDNVNIHVGKKKYNDMPLDSLVGQTLYFSNTKGVDSTMVATKIDIKCGRHTEYHCHEDIPLPVTWLGFSANVKGQEIVVKWSTAMELDNDKFIIEKYFAHGWDSVGSMKGRGTTWVTTIYEFWDNQPLEGANIYRIKQVDYNGNFEYSKWFKANYTVEMVEDKLKGYNIIGQRK